MKPLSILLVTTVSVCLAKSPTNNRFPDILAPIRGMFASRGNYSPPEKTMHQGSHDSSGAETRRPGVPHPVDENGEGFRPYFQSSEFQNSPYESHGLGAARRPEIERPQFQPEGRPLPQHPPEGRPGPQFSPDGRSPPQFNLEGRPPPYFSAESHPLTRFSREGRSPFQYSPEGRSPPHFGSGPLEFSPDSRPPPEYIPEGRNLAHFYPESRNPQFTPEDSPHFHKRPTRQHRPPPHQLNPHQHPSHGFPDYSPQNFHDEKSTGFTDFSFNPADFDSASFGGRGRGDERRPFGGDSPPFHTSKPAPYGGPRHEQTDYPEHFTRSAAAGREVVAVNDLQRGSSGNGEKVVYFDDVYQQPPGNLPLNPGRFQQDSNRRPVQSPRSAPSKFRASPTLVRENESETRNKSPVYKPKPQGDNNAHFGSPLLMSGSSTSPPVIVTPKNDQNTKHSDSVPAPSFHRRKSKWDSEEPIAAASGHGGGVENYGGNDRILYHVAGHAGPYSYRFGYDTGSGYNRMFRHEEKDGNGLVKGKYGFHDKSGKLQVINYSAHPTGGFHSERAH